MISMVGMWYVYLQWLKYECWICAFFLNDQISILFLNSVIYNVTIFFFLQIDVLELFYDNLFVVQEIIAILLDFL